MRTRYSDEELATQLQQDLVEGESGHIEPVWESGERQIQAVSLSDAEGEVPLDDLCSWYNKDRYEATFLEESGLLLLMMRGPFL